MNLHTGRVGAIVKAALLAAVVIISARPSFAQFTEITPLPQALISHSAVIWNNVIYVAGGVSDIGSFTGQGGTLNTVYYCASVNPDGTLGAWRVANKMPEFLGLGMHASVAYNGWLYVLGGTNLFGPRNVVYYSSINPDGSLAAWQQAVPMPRALAAHAAALSGNRIYVLGGIVRSQGATDEVYYADIAADGSLGAWKQTVSLPTRLFGHKAFISGGKVFVLGGTTDNTFYTSGWPSPKTSDKVYAANLNADGTLGPWSLVSILAGGISLHAAASTARNIYILGGYTGISVSNAVYSAPLADGALGAWQALAALPTGLLSLASAATEEYLYALGGGLTYINKPQSSVYSLKLDNTAPSSIAELAGAAGRNGWHVSEVTVALTATDALSGVAGAYYSLDGTPFALYTAPFAVSAEGGHLLKYYAVDKAKNIEPEKSLTFKIDLGAPRVSAAATPAANLSGWNNIPVSVVLAGTDAVSGIAYCEPGKLASVEGASQTVSGYCADYAGWSSTAAYTLSIDTTQPLIAYARTPANTEGWNNGNVSVGFGCSDGLSGIASCPVGILYSAEGVNISTSARALDFAGNYRDVTVTGINIDKTPPVSTASLSGTYRNGWYSSEVNIALGSTDLLSGVNGTYYSLDGGEFAGYRQALSVSGDGAHELRYYSGDKAGNSAPADKVEFKIDTSLPAVGYELVPPANLNGWNKEAVTVKFGGADALSGIAYCSPDKIISTEGASQTVSGYCADYAGNSNAAALTVNIDMTSPVITISSPAAGQVFIAAKNKIQVGFALADNIDSSPLAEAFLVQVEDKGSPRGVRPDKLPVTSGQLIESLDIDDGIWRLTVSATDFAFNSSSAAGGAFEVMHDVLPPRTVLTAGAGGYQGSGQALYLTGRTTFTLTSIDDLVAAADGIGLGVKKQGVGVSAEGRELLRELIFENTTPVQGAVFTSAFRLDQEIDGAYNLAFNSEDVLANVEKIKISTFIVDNTPPQTVFARVSGPAYQNYVSTWTLFELSPTDPGAFASGVKETAYSINSGGIATTPLKFTLPGVDGDYLVKYQSRDNVENLEVEKSSQVFVDAAPPFSALNVVGGKQSPGAQPGSFYASLDSKFGFTAVDPLIGGGASGVKAIESADNGGLYGVYNQPISLNEGKHTITYRATDRVENTEVTRSTQIYIDNTAPVTSFNITEPLYIKDEVRYITPVSALTLTAIDPLTKEVAAGVERIETAVDSGAYALYTAALKFPEGRHTIKYRAYDNVGNLEAAHTLEVQSDATAPESRWLAASGLWVEKDNEFYLNAAGSIALESADPVVHEVASGLEDIYYGIDDAPTVKYTAAFSLSEGVRTVNYNAKDNLGNTELVKSTVVYVDGTKPVSALSFSGDQYNGDKQYISQRTDIIITAADPVINNVAVGVKDTRYSVDGGLFAAYSLFKLSAEGKRLVSYYSTDFVSNTEAVKTTALWVDNTPPATELSIAGVRYLAPGDEKLYVTRDSVIVLTSADSISNDTASGVMLTKYRLDGGNWLVYLGSFTIAAEGLHTLEYYALDRVQNAEALKSVIIAVDNTPPVTAISLGEPKSEVFGLPVIMQNTPITLAAADPVINSVSAGLNSIFYELENAQTGARSLVTAYTSPFTITEQGTFIIRYWSRDNTGNAEMPKEKTAAVATWRADGLIAASGLDMSGTADISGAVKSNAVVSLSGNARILGPVTASAITLTGKAQITGLQITGAAPVNPAPIYLAGIVQNAAAVNNNALVGQHLVDGKLALSSKVNITLSTGAYYFKGLDLSGGSSIMIDGKVDIMVEGGITINGGSSLNASGEASRLSIIVSTASELKFNGGGALAACVYAPYSDMKLTGNALLGGHYFVKSAAVSGTGNLIQSGEASPVAAAQPVGGPKTKTAAIPGSRVGILAGPDPEFRLGEVYVFPNPAKGSEAPVFHIETGIADSVKITIYTISGRAAHEHTLAGLPAELDDGNGLSYAYEYTWSGHIPSGIYLYYIEAQKAGQTLKKTGKFGVVR